MSLRIGSPRPEETQEVYSVYKSSQEQLIGAVYTLSNHIISNSPAGPDSTRFVRDVVQPVSRLDDKLGQLCAKLPNIEKVSSDKEEIVSKKRHFEPEKDQSPTRKKSKIGCSELPSNEGPTANVQPNDSLPRLIFDLEGIDENTFKIAADIQPGDSNAKQVQKSMDYLNKRRGYLCLPPIAYDESVSFVTYEKGFEQMVRVNYLKFWRHIPNGDQFLQKNPNIEYFSSLPELKLALRSFLKTCYLELDYLDLNDAKLVMLPPEIEELSDLTHLETQNSNLTVLPKEMGKLIHLKELLLNGNELTSLPKEIGDLCQLRNLNLSANDKLMCLPDELEKLTQLECLDLSDRGLTSLPRVVGKLTGLKYLILKGNKLTSLPDELEKLTELGYLDLRFNKLVAFPEWVKDLDSLKKVLFEGNACKVSDYVR